jgi:hypothetical protein
MASFHRGLEGPRYPCRSIPCRRKCPSQLPLSGSPVVPLLLVAEVPDPRDERHKALRSRPTDRLGLRLRSVQDMIGLIFDDVVLDTAMFVMPFGAGFDKDVRHRFLRPCSDSRGNGVIARAFQHRALLCKCLLNRRHGRVFGAFHLDPIGRGPGAIRPVDPLYGWPAGGLDRCPHYGGNGLRQHHRGALTSHQIGRRTLDLRHVIVAHRTSFAVVPRNRNLAPRRRDHRTKVSCQGTPANTIA